MTILIIFLQTAIISFFIAGVIWLLNFVLSNRNNKHKKSHKA